MFLIFGTRGVRSTQHRGRFFCPSCGRDTAYNHISVRRFFTLFFIPVIPLDQVGEYVECQRCNGTFRPEVLSYDPRESQKDVHAEFEVVMRRVISLMVGIDGEIHEGEVRVVSGIFQQLTGHTLTADEVRKETSSIRRARRALAKYLPPMAGVLNDSGKEMILTAAVMVAAADGRLDESELDLIGEIGRHLEMSKAHVRGVMEETLKPEGASN
jgi:uncharacterized tellurite resistance protein B-like protein